MEEYFIRIELYKGKPTDVQYVGGDINGDVRPNNDVKGMALQTWNDFPFKVRVGAPSPEGTAFFDICESAVSTIKAWGDKLGGGFV